MTRKNSDSPGTVAIICGVLRNAPPIFWKNVGYAILAVGIGLMVSLILGYSYFRSSMLAEEAAAKENNILAEEHAAIIERRGKELEEDEEAALITIEDADGDSVEQKYNGITIKKE